MIEKRIKESILVKQKLLEKPELIKEINRAISIITKSFINGNKILFCGNGGSAADAQHLAAELSGRFYYDREPLPAEACHTNTSFLTAVANDFSYEETYGRFVKGFGKKGDVLFAISTSGKSANIVKAVEQAIISGMHTIGLTGNSGGKLNKLVDVLINIPSTDTARIQETHILVGHIICEEIEKLMFPK